MRKIIKKIGIVTLMMIMSLMYFYKPVIAHAEDNDVMVIKIPTNEIGMIDYFANASYAEFMLIDVLCDVFADPDIDTIMINNDGKRIINTHITEETMYFELYEGATEEDCIVELPSAIADAAHAMGLNYNKVHFVLREMSKYEPTGESVVIDLTEINNLLTTPALSLYLLDFIANPSYGYFTKADSNLYRNLDGKTLVKMKDNDKDVLELKDATDGDDIVLELSSTDIEELAEKEIDVTGYENIAIKFGTQKYDETYFVLDCSTNENLNTNYRNFKKLWDFFAEKKLVKPVAEVLIFYDNNGQELFKLPEYTDGIFVVDELNDLKYEDNITIDISNNETVKTDLENNFGITNAKQVIIKFGEPDFIEGEGQEVNLNTEDELSFRLNISFDEFLESGVVYLDDEIVDPSNYEATEGSTIITFKKDYVSGLDTGNHVIRVSVSDGTATAAFNVVGESPATGDGILIYLSLLFMSATGLFFMRRKRLG